MRTQKVRKEKEKEKEKRTATRNGHGYNDCLVEFIGGRPSGILLVTVLHTRQLFHTLLRFQELQKLLPSGKNCLPFIKLIKRPSILCNLIYNPFDINLGLSSLHSDTGHA